MVNHIPLSGNAPSGRSLPLISPEEYNVLMGRAGPVDMPGSGLSWPAAPHHVSRRLLLELPLPLARRLDREARRLGMPPGELALACIAREVGRRPVAP